MSKPSPFAPTPQSFSRPASPGGYNLGSPGGLDKDEDRQGLMMSNLGPGGREGLGKKDEHPPQMSEQGGSSLREEVDGGADR